LCGSPKSSGARRLPNIFASCRGYFGGELPNKWAIARVKTDSKWALSAGLASAVVEIIY
jgi:hypothetical protein